MRKRLDGQKRLAVLKKPRRAEEARRQAAANARRQTPPPEEEEDEFNFFSFAPPPSSGSSSQNDASDPYGSKTASRPTDLTTLISMSQSQSHAAEHPKKNEKKKHGLLGHKIPAAETEHKARPRPAGQVSNEVRQTPRQTISGRVGAARFQDLSFVTYGAEFLDFLQDEITGHWGRGTRHEANHSRRPSDRALSFHYPMEHHFTYQYRWPLPLQWWQHSTFCRW